MTRRPVPVAAVPVAAALLAGVLAAGCSPGRPPPGRPAAAAERSGAASTPRPAAPKPSTAPATSAAPPVGCVTRQLAGLSLPQRVAQLFDVGVPATSIGSGSPYVPAGAGGVFLRGRSTAGLALAPQIQALQQQAQAAGLVPPHVSADQEGGLVSSVTGPGIPAWPSAREQAQWPLPELATRGAQWAASLHALGLTLDLAPVADVVPVAGRTANPPIGRYGREYGASAPAAAERVAAVTRALQGAQVVATAKHFPGLGRVPTNPDTSPTSVDAVTTDADLLPFAAAVAAGAGAVMVSSATYLRIDPVEPAVWSRPVVTGLLRERLGFRGLVLSDDLSAARVVQAVAPGARAVRFLAAGGDMVVILDAADLAPMVAAVLQEARRSTAFAARVDDAAGHVLRSKQTVGLLRCPT